ncbi:MAG: phosphoenolpyruvate--protein phosphotransferase [Candidatus Krumholzibacteriia bacterium]
MQVHSGIAASPGYAYGPVQVMRKQIVSAPRRSIEPSEVPAEQARFRAALDRARDQLAGLVAKLARELGPDEAGILSTQLLMLEDEMVVDATLDLVAAKLVNAEAAFTRAVGDIVLQLHDAQDEALRERIVDLRDMEERVLLAFGDKAPPVVVPPAEPKVIAARNLTPSDTALLGREHVLGFVIDEGGPTGHVAILARSLGVPAVLGLGGVAAGLAEGCLVALDGETGELFVDPDAATRERIEQLGRRAVRVTRKLDYLRDLPAVTPDGRRVILLANIELPAEVDEALARGAEGIGLLRTEYFFFQRQDIPSEQDQVATYSEILRRMEGRTVIFRTLDVGGDKVSEYLGARREYNPFLGWRGIRFSLANRPLFKTQVRAIYQAAARGPARIMFPMITGVEELRAARDVCLECRDELAREGLEHDPALPVGLMIETPSAAAIADLLAAECDFFSIGTNDLIQYTLAMDRGNSRVSYLYQPLHPAVLRAIRQVVDAAHAVGIEAGLCGEMGSETRLAEVMLGLGLDELSVTGAALAKVKQVIRWTDYAEARSLVDRLLQMTTAAQADAYVAGYVEARKQSRAAAGGVV